MATPRGAEHRDLEQRFKDLERKLKEVTSLAQRRPKFEVSDGDFTISGGALIVDGGDFLLLDTDGSNVFRLGPQFFGDRGVTISRDDGTEVFSTSKEFSAGDPQRWRMKDSAGNLVLGETVFGVGLERPYLPMPMQPTGAAGTAVTVGPYGFERVVTGTAFGTVFAWQGPRQNQWFLPTINIRTSDTTTAAEVRCIDDTGAVIAGFFNPAWTGTAAVGSAADRAVVPPYGLSIPGDYGDDVRIRLQVRRSAGAGTINVAVRSCNGHSA